MRILHTSDWHLGRLFHQVSLLDDQVALLDQVVDIARDRAVDAVVIAGDVFDRSVPPAAAVSVLDHVLNRLAAEPAIPVILVPGNHDSAERLGFGAGVMAGAGIHIRHRFDGDPVRLADAHGEVLFHCLPYADPASVADALGVPCASHDEAMAALLARIDPAPGARHVLVAHCFVHGGEVRDSERPLSVGGAQTVSLSNFAPFHYTALGHLHNRQSFADGRVRYSGSLMKYSFSESEDQKSVLLVDLDGDGAVDVEAVPLAPTRDVRVIEGAFDTLLAEAPLRGRDDYLLARLTDTRAILDVMATLRRVYPNLLHVERPAMVAEGRGVLPVERLHTGEMPLVEDFWRQVTGHPLDDVCRRRLAAVLDRVRGDRAEDG